MEQAMESMITGLLIEQALILVPVLWVIGYVCKRTRGFPDWLIPTLLLVAGIAGGALIVGGAEGAAQGILAAGAAVLANQITIQNKKRS